MPRLALLFPLALAAAGSSCHYTTSLDQYAAGSSSAGTPADASAHDARLDASTDPALPDSFPDAPSFDASDERDSGVDQDVIADVSHEQPDYPDAGDASGERPECVSDFNCYDDDPCTVDDCDEGHCVRRAHDGRTLIPDPAAPTAFTILDGLDEIGPPTVMTDNSGFLVGVWLKRGAETDVYITRHFADASQSATGVYVSKQSSLNIRSAHSSPAFAPVVLDGGKTCVLTVLVGTNSSSTTGVLSRTLDPMTLAPCSAGGLHPSPTLHTAPLQDFGASTYTRPHLIAGKNQAYLAAWIEKSAIYTWMWSAATGEASLAKPDLGMQINDAALAVGTGDFGQAGGFAAIVDGLDQGSAKTSLWTGNTTSLKILDGEPGPRLGISAAGATQGVSIMWWSRGTSTGALGSAAIVTCMAHNCFDLPAGQYEPGVFPSSAVAVRANSLLQSVGAAAIGLLDPQGTGGPEAQVVLSLAIPADTDVLYNPRAVLVSDEVAFMAMLGPTAVGITLDERVLVVWTERTLAGGTWMLRGRRFVTGSCQ